MRVFFAAALLLIAASARAASSAGLDAHIRDLAQPDYQVRWKALDALARLGPQARPAVPALINRLADEHDRYRAISVLGAVGPAAAPTVPTLLRRLAYTLSVEDKIYRDESTEAIGIIETLAKIGPAAKDAVPLLRQALTDKVSTIRYFAAHALGELGPEAKTAIPDLQALRSDHEYVGLYEYPHGTTVDEAAAQTLQKLQDMANDAQTTEPGPPDWKRIDVKGKFAFFVPPDMETKTVSGTDSNVGKYQNNNLRLRFDYVGKWQGTRRTADRKDNIPVDPVLSVTEPQNAPRCPSGRPLRDQSGRVI